MAQDDSTRAANGSNGSGTEPQAATLAQYIKDLSVESPSAPQVYQWQDQPALGVNFLVDLSFAGLFGLRNFPEEAVAPFLLIEAPRLLFPFARQIVCESIQNMGFPPLLLEPIDFGAAYMAQVQAAQQQQQQQVESDADAESKADEPATEGSGEA